MEQTLLALQMFLHGQDDRPDTWLKNGLFLPSKSPTAWHHGMAHALFSTHLHSLDGPMAMEEQRPSLETPTWQTNDRPKNSPLNGHFWTLNGP